MSNSDNDGVYGIYQTLSCGEKPMTAILVLAVMVVGFLAAWAASKKKVSAGALIFMGILVILCVFYIVQRVK